MDMSIILLAFRDIVCFVDMSAVLDHVFLLVPISPAVAYCCGLCLLSVSWALVLYSRACCLIRPGHLAMPPAAMLCQLVWRVGMLGARVTCLMVFARVFNWWVCGVAGEQGYLSH